jgi:DNA-binding transcriptional MocR family regulator
MKYREVMDVVKEKISSGELKSGQRLPSIRVMTGNFNCSKATIIRAYEELQLMHYIYAIPKSGFYVLDQLKKIPEGSHVYDFHTVGPDEQLIPYNAFMHSMNKAIEKYAKNLFEYESPVGMRALREVLKDYFESHGIYSKIEDIVITSGAQQALNLIFSAIAMQHKEHKPKIAVEEPTYRMVHTLLRQLDMDVIGVNRSEHGMDWEALREAFKKADYFYTIPRFHNPLGTSLTEGDKKRVLALANQHSVRIIEDDYLGDMETHTSAMPLFYYDVSDNVIHVKSFSKGFMPGIRLGCIVFNRNSSLINQVIALKHSQDFCTPVYTQGALEIFIKSGMYQRHLKKLKSVYLDKMKHLKFYIEANSPRNIICHVPETGIFIWMDIKGVGWEFIDVLKSQDVLVSDGRSFHTDHFRHESATFRICTGPMSYDKIVEGLSIIFTLAKEREGKS